MSRWVVTYKVVATDKSEIYYYIKDSKDFLTFISDLLFGKCVFKTLFIKDNKLTKNYLSAGKRDDHAYIVPPMRPKFEE
ncbi:hypothetical protein Bhyg_15386 [Pseudolycoriella hygida]|uniref:Uncharacterized protein n=1 Tax=Pseudolycoriella hygida TaxID=35572 RepID=A0A9Q0RY69_9DIPT|nr:hypothetical protein Bhyg_15386 [Pseudolycoriella hygida]